MSTSLLYFAIACYRIALVYKITTKEIDMRVAMFDTASVGQRLMNVYVEAARERESMTKVFNDTADSYVDLDKLVVDSDGELLSATGQPMQLLAAIGHGILVHANNEKAIKEASNRYSKVRETAYRFFHTNVVDKVVRVEALTEGTTPIRQLYDPRARNGAGEHPQPRHLDSVAETAYMADFDEDLLRLRRLSLGERGACDYVTTYDVKVLGEDHEPLVKLAIGQEPWQ